MSASTIARQAAERFLQMDQDVAGWKELSAIITSAIAQAVRESGAVEVLQASLEAELKRLTHAAHPIRRDFHSRMVARYSAALAALRSLAEPSKKETT